MELVQIYFKYFSKITMINIFLSFFLLPNFKFCIPGSGSRRENEYGSMRVWIHSLG